VLVTQELKAAAILTLQSAAVVQVTNVLFIAMNRCNSVEGPWLGALQQPLCPLEIFLIICLLIFQSPLATSTPLCFYILQ